MMKNNFSVLPEDVQVVDGKVLISSEELAAAIQSQSIDLNGEEENAAMEAANGFCIIF